MEIDLTKEEIEYIISWGRLTDGEFELDNGEQWELFHRFINLKERLEIEEKKESE